MKITKERAIIYLIHGVIFFAFFFITFELGIGIILGAMLFFYLSIFTLFSVIAVALIRKKAFYAVMLLTLPVAMILGMYFGTYIGTKRYEVLHGKEDRVRAAVVVRAIDSYRDKNGKAPTELNDLVPEFLEAVPVTTYGTEFYYSPHATDSAKIDERKLYRLRYQDSFTGQCYGYWEHAMQYWASCEFPL